LNLKFKWGLIEAIDFQWLENNSAKHL
jgi:hypothetical protein